MLSVDSSASVLMGAVSLFSSASSTHCGNQNAADALDKAVPPDDDSHRMFSFGRPLFLFAAGGTAANDAFSVAATEALQQHERAHSGRRHNKISRWQRHLDFADEFADAEGADRFLRTG